MKVAFFLILVALLGGGILFFDTWLMSDSQTHVIKVVVPGAPK